MKRVLVDLTNVVWTSLQAGKDREGGRKVEFEGKMHTVNSAEYGFDNAVNHMTAMMRELGVVPSQLILVPDGKNSKQDRRVMHPLYKSGRDKPPEQTAAFNECKEKLIDTFLGVGSLMAWQDGGVEADDVLGYLAHSLDGEIWIDSGDKDLAQLVGIRPNVHHYRAGKIDENPFGDFPHQFIPVWIALVGDSGDKIPGARGFGETSGQDLLSAFGADGLELMEGLIKTKTLARLDEDIQELLLKDCPSLAKALQKVIDDADGVYLSHELGRLRIERVNTVRRPLQWRVGMVKPREDCEEQDLRKHAGLSRIVCAENYAEAVDWARKQIALSPYVALDIETSTPPESDEWLELRGKENKVDVFGSELTSLQMTFGPNLQYSVFLPLDNVPEKGVSNLTIDQIVDFVDLVPRHKITYVHSAAFELPVCYMAWDGRWADDPLYHGFLRNVRCTRIGSSYVDENVSAGLKSLSQNLLGYNQTTYQQVVTKDYNKSDWNGQGKVLQTYFEPTLEDRGETEEIGTGEMEPVVEVVDGETKVEYREKMKTIPKLTHVGDIERVVVEHKMNQLTARQVLVYGCDDTICTAALANYQRCVMEIEKTWSVYEEVETYPAYLHALAYVQGTEYSLEHMAAMEADDDVAYNAAAPILHDYLMKIGFDGTTCPVFDQMVPAQIKEAIVQLTGLENAFKCRLPDKVSKVLDMWADELLELSEDNEVAASRIRLLSAYVKNEDVAGMNELVQRHFVGNPKLDLASPKQMARLLYDHMKLPVRVINDVTPLEREKQPELNDAIRKFKRIRAGTSTLSLTDEELVHVRKKASSDDTAIDMALAFDTELIDDETRAVLKAIGAMKKVMTRRSLFYNNYRHVLHWKDRKIHANVNQSTAVTRRGSADNPNLQQLPKKGEGVRFRGGFKPHKKNAVIASIDYVGQELRLAAWRSQDKNMLACYVGDHLKDIHSMTAAGAMPLKWGKARVESLFETHGADLRRDSEEAAYDLFLRLRGIGKADPIGKEADDLRKDSKNVNFGAQNLAQAVRLAETLIMRVEDAQLFLDARAVMFPDVDRAAVRAADFARKNGYVLTMMGGRRHLREAMRSDAPGVADRAARQAWNFEIQGSAGEMTKMGETRLWLSGIYFRYDARFIAPVHDELVSSVTKEHAVDFLREKHACMAQPYADMQVPVLGSISIGPDFAKQFECGDEFIEANIVKALGEIFAKNPSTELLAA